jgi:hypothetical protein
VNPINEGKRANRDASSLNHRDHTKADSEKKSRLSHAGDAITIKQSMYKGHVHVCPRQHLLRSKNDEQQQARAEHTTLSRNPDLKSQSARFCQSRRPKCMPVSLTKQDGWKGAMPKQQAFTHAALGRCLRLHRFCYPNEMLWKIDKSQPW